MAIMFTIADLQLLHKDSETMLFLAWSQKEKDAIVEGVVQTIAAAMRVIRNYL